jgi:hypothetical protein
MYQDGVNIFGTKKEHVPAKAGIMQKETVM